MNFACNDRCVLITGASAGIGEACARAFAAQGARLILCARRLDRLQALASELEQAHQSDVLPLVLDVSDAKAVKAAIDNLPEHWQAIDILINNAGLARGMERIQEAETADWDAMIDTNIKGLLYLSRYVTAGMVARNSGHVVNIGSISGRNVYSGGAVYCATKHAVKAISQALKMDLQGTAIRVSEVDPGAVETEFSMVRFDGDAARAKKVYANMRPLHGEDIADAVLYCVTRPAHVTVQEITVMPTDQPLNAPPIVQK